MQQLFHRIDGEGEPIVLLHGFLASSQYFKVLRRRLSRTHRVIAIDLLGFGRSPKPDACEYTYSDHISALHSTLQSLGLKRFMLVGHSLGALIALRYSLTYPNAVQALGLLNPPMYRTPKEAVTIFQSTGLHYRALLHSRSREMLWAIIKVLPRFPLNQQRPPINLTDVMLPTKTSRGKTYQNVILNAQFFTDANKLTVRTLLAVGKRDRPQYQQNIASWNMPPNIIGICTPTGHHLPTINPMRTERIIRTQLLS